MKQKLPLILVGILILAGVACIAMMMFKKQGCDRDQIFADLGLEPYQVAKGGIKGFKVNFTPACKANIGLQRGDIILSIDKKPLTSATALMEAFNGLTEKSSAQLEVSRAGQPASPVEIRF